MGENKARTQGLHRAARGPKTLGPRGQATAGPPKAPKEPTPGKAPSRARGSLETWLAENGVRDKDAEGSEDRSGAERGIEARRLAALRPQAALDLHGMTGEEAEAAIADFLRTASRMGLEKVLVIHGKGLHSSGAPVLKKAARRALEHLAQAGRFGEAERADGGSGALWVQIRRVH